MKREVEKLNCHGSNRSKTNHLTANRHAANCRLANRHKAMLRSRMEERLRSDLEVTKRSLEAAHSNFQNAVDEELIDCYIYEVNAAQLRYAFLLRKLKECQGQG